MVKRVAFSVGHTTIVALLLLLHPSPCNGQSDTSEARKSAPKPGSVRDAVRIVTETLESTSELRSPANRIKVRRAAAGILWKLDNARALEAYSDIVNDFRELSVEAEGVDGEPTFPETVARLRAEVARQMGEHDPSLAMNFLNSTSSLATRQADTPVPSGDSETQLKVFLAGKMASKDPRRAYDIAMTCLSEHAYAWLPELIISLKGKDERLARDLVSALLDKLLAGDLADNSETFLAAVDLLRVDAKGGDENHNGEASNNLRSHSLLQEQKKALLVNRLLAAALSPAGKARWLPSQLATSGLQFSDSAPTAAQTLDRYLASSGDGTPAAERVLRDYQERIAKSPPSEALAGVADAPKELRDLLYQQVARQAASSGDVATAEQIIAGHVSDAGRRRELLDRLLREEISGAASRGDMGRVRELLPRLSSPGERARALVEAADKFRSTGGGKTATALLEEAISQISPRPGNASQLGLRLQIAGAFTRLGSPDRAADILGSAVRQLNEVIDAAKVVGGFVRETDVYEKGELSLVADGAIIGLYYDCAQALSFLGRVDLDRALAAADLFQQPEARLMARLLATEGALGDSDHLANHVPGP